MRIKRLLKIGGATIAALAGLLVACLPVALTTVDESSYRDQPCRAETASRLQHLNAGANTVFGELLAGFGRAKLTPVLGGDNPSAGSFRSMPLAGYGARKGRPATGVEQDVWVKAVAFSVAGKTGVIVTADALLIPREVADVATERLRDTRGLARGSVYLSSTHTHSSLGGWGQGYVSEQFAGPFVSGAREWFAQQLVVAALASLDNLEPAVLGQGAFTAPDFVRNRLLGDTGPKDPEFTVLLVRQADGDSAVVGSYAAHATVLSASNMRFNGDYPGYWAAAVEQGSRGMAMFLAGGVGSHGPRPGKSGLEGAQHMGQALAERTLRALGELTLTNRIALGVLSLPTALPALQIRVSDGVRLRPWLAQALFPVNSETILQGFRLNNALWLSTPCDFSGELALPLKQAARQRGVTLSISSFNGDYVGYVIPSKYYHRNGYEPRTMSFYGPQLPDYFVELLQQMIDTLGDPMANSRYSR